MVKDHVEIESINHKYRKYPWMLWMDGNVGYMYVLSTARDCVSSLAFSRTQLPIGSVRPPMARRKLHQSVKSINITVHVPFAQRL
jgi:hypothetical protein